MKSFLEACALAVILAASPATAVEPHQADRFGS
jgi:hypothetical protein